MNDHETHQQQDPKPADRRAADNGLGHTELAGQAELVLQGSRLSIIPNQLLTAQQVPELQAALKHKLAQGVTHVLFDLDRTTMLDSSGIGLLIATSNHLAERSGSVAVINVSPDIWKLLQSMRLVKRLNASARQQEESPDG